MKGTFNYVHHDSKHNMLNSVLFVGLLISSNKIQGFFAAK